MKEILQKSFDPGNHTAAVPYSLLFLRVVTGIFMLTHGYKKLLMLTGGGPIQFADPIGIGMTASLIMAVFAEVICSVLLIFGLATRFSVIPLIFTMLVAALVIHADDGFARKELPLLYASVLAVIAIAGPGRLSLDNLIHRKLKG